MAATTRTASPHTESFPPVDSDPRTPTSTKTTTSGAAHSRNLTTPTSSAKSALKHSSLSPASGKRGASPQPLTGAAAIAELRKRKQQEVSGGSRDTSPNPAVQAMQNLFGRNEGMSKPSDAPAAAKLSEPLQRAAEKMSVDQAQADSMQTSPASMSSFGTFESSGTGVAMTATANNAAASGHQFVAEPAEIAAEPTSYSSSNGLLGVASDQEGSKALSFSYPGPPPPQEQVQEGALARGMSLPGYGQGQDSPKSPASSNKRHKCPYCSTDFTRHHNLKSHLLTHSQEKPYVCQTCQARFRRLHDLKRHTKLHTGERPHTCDKCGRRFARGDALARHNKGPGGCAGRRSSFGGDDDGDGEGDDGMLGVEYDNEEEVSSPDQGRRGSEPNRKRVHLETPRDPSREVYRQQSSTYPPPPQPRPHPGSLGNMGPPQVVFSGQSTVHSPREMSNHPSPAGGSSISSSYYGGQMLPNQGGMIESPKPLSPSQPVHDQHRLSVGDASHPSTIHRNRSPSLTTQFQQAHFGRGSGGRTPPQPPSQFPTSHHGGQQMPVLPPLGSQPQSRQPSSLQPGLGPSMLHHQQVPPPSTHTGGPGSNPGSLSSHGRSSGSSIRDVMGQDPNDIWSYVRSLEQRFGRMQDEYELRISRLQEEVISLKGQMSNAASYSSDMGAGPGQGPGRY
ncbi:hypothetical protein LTR37_016443 [Vermiconidia calcicola]|uniref:Uncharacterized protein n=1 Tax=Vermiconidia calcicola TaxID=1690605 RepID=A0ACC3MP11_9PEZI|nr:hypothetical protein LTR37_016443 [Vermiconidia calcicola]